MELSGIIAIGDIKDEIYSLDWAYFQNADEGLTKGRPRPTEINFVVKTIANSKTYFDWAKDPKDKKDIKISFNGPKNKGVLITIEAKQAVCTKFQFHFDKEEPELATFVISLSATELSYVV